MKLNKRLHQNTLKQIIIGLFVSSVILLFGCNSPDSEKVNEVENDQNSETTSANKTYSCEPFLGTYVGDFGKNFIHITLTYLTPEKVVGYSLFKGKQRNLIGTVRQGENSLFLTFEEPGDLPTDGTFTVEISKKELVMVGKWVCFSEIYPSKSIQLQKVNKLSKEELEKKRFHDQELETVYIDAYNFLDYFSNGQGNNGDITFSEDGLVVYDYYADVELQERREQVTPIFGSWRFIKAQTIEIFWSQNDYFPPKSMEFEIIRNTDDLPELVGDDFSISINYMY